MAGVPGAQRLLERGDERVLRRVAAGIGPGEGHGGHGARVGRRRGAGYPSPSITSLFPPIGPWATVFVSAGLLVSVLGAFLAWTLMAAEILQVAAQDGDMPRFLAPIDDRGVPAPALLISTLLVQAMLVLTMFSADAFDFALEFCAALSLIPYFFSAAYAVRIASGRDGGRDGASRGHLVIAVLATVYTVFLLFAAGWELLLLSLVVYALSTVLFVMTRREKQQRTFTPRELLVVVLVCLGAVAGIVGLAIGFITL
ncbi:amino acid permease [Brevibacterium samyangense]|uniref:amino acid permease n=1 Tax=Brevibacterium samyangense TaxID=366888 RepID=UPI0031D3D2CB